MDNYYTQDFRKGFIQRRVRKNWAEIRGSLSRILNRTTGGTAATSTLIAITSTPLIVQHFV